MNESESRRSQAKCSVEKKGEPCFQRGESVEFIRRGEWHLGVVEWVGGGFIGIWFHGRRFRLGRGEVRRTHRTYCPGF